MPFSGRLHGFHAYNARKSCCNKALLCVQVEYAGYGVSAAAVERIYLQKSFEATISGL